MGSMFEICEMKRFIIIYTIKKLRLNGWFKSIS